MTKCDYCDKEIDGLPFQCRRCKQYFCGDHRLPENHDCKGTKYENFFEPLTKKSTTKFNASKSKSYEGNYEMYTPGRKKHNSYQNYRNFNPKNFLKKYIYPRIQGDVKPPLMQFLLIFLIGLVLNYVYYQTFSLNYLFIGGVNEWFNVLMPTLNYGFNASYNLFYLVINGIYYAYFYYSFILVIYHTITNLDKRDTWVMLGWFAVILFILIKFFPQIV
jgi:hypothetical protein